VYLQYLTESFYSAATQKNIRLLFHSEERAIMMDYDEDKIQQIVYNLLSNAIKFTPEQGKIIFHASKIEKDTGAFLKLKVKDSGLGIANDHIDHIFDQFYQVNQAGIHPGAGTGIGLALTKELVELMRGKIEVQSIVGEGTEFIVYLPIEAQIEEAAGVLLSEENKSRANLGLIPPEVELIEAFDGIESSYISALPELLIIEDNQDIITYIKTILKDTYKIYTVRNGALGIEKGLELIPDIIISDVMMPEKSGYQVCEILKKDQRTSHIPIILLTAKVSQADKLIGLKYGADAYLTKPFDKEELLIRLEKLVQSRQQLQQHYANGADIFHSAEPSVDDIFLQKLWEHIQNNLNETEFGVAELSSAAGMSQMQIYRKLKALTGKTPSQFIRSYRLRKGIELLQKGELNISQVAYETGFNDPSYFSRVFQKEFGRNPSDFLK
jgi:DNA-binding response OmpR family regulator